MENALPKLLSNQNSSAVTDLEVDYDLSKLLAEVNSLIQVCPFFETTNQISLKIRPKSKFSNELDQFQDGIGSLFDFDNKIWTGHESQFSILHPRLEGSYIHQIIEQLETTFPVKIGRLRIMRLKARACYSWHFDQDEYRFHIPLLTNPNCFFMTKEWGLESMPVCGRLYTARTNVFHSAMNCSKEDRIHLVFSTFCTE